MSETFDVNILLFASDDDSRHQTKARALIERFAAGPGIVYALWPVIVGYLRIATHPTALGRPLPISIAKSNIDALLSRPHVRCVSELDGFWQHFSAVGDDVPLRGNLMSDAHIVALMRQHGIGTIWSHDRDFRKFSGIRVRDPFA